MSSNEKRTKRPKVIDSVAIIKAASLPQEVQPKANIYIRFSHNYSTRKNIKKRQANRNDYK